MTSGVPQNETVRDAGSGQEPSCPGCAKLLEGEANFCPACGADLRGLGAQSDTLRGPLKDKLIDRRYRVLEKLGEGGMGSVYKVEHVRLGKVAALKLMRPDAAVDKELKARFLQEARVVAKLSHPNTVSVFDTGELDDGTLFIAMEFVPGKDLAWHLRAHGPLSEGKAIAIGLQVLASLQEAHEHGIVHRDIKPANVMLVRRRNGEDQAKLLDFGIAKLAEAEGRKSITGDFVGTPAYMAPEQIRGEHVDARSDLYSLGALLFELVTGTQLFDGPTPASIITQHTTSAIPSISERRAEANVSPQFEAALRRALAKEPRNRFPDAESMRVSLQALGQPAHRGGVEVTPIPPGPRDRMLSRQDFDRFERRLRLRRALTPVVALGVVVALGGLGWSRVFSKEPPEARPPTELEPNDRPEEATRVAMSTDIAGTIGARAGGESDRDVYLLQLPATGRFRLTLSGVPDLNLTAEVLQLEAGGEGERLRRRVFLDDVSLGEGERVDALQLAAGPVYLRVEERPYCTEAPRPAREKSLLPYFVRFEPMEPREPAEVEPNDSESAAQPLPMTKSLVAWTGARVDEVDRLSPIRPAAPFSTSDWFRIEAESTDAVFLVVVPPERGGLWVLDPGKKGGERRPLLVQGEPLVLELGSSTGPRRVRISTGPESGVGAAYHLAAASNAENGLAGLLDVARELEASGRLVARRHLLEKARRALTRSPQAARLATLLEEQ